MVGLSTGVGAMAAGGSHTCALTTAGSVKCWGSNLYGQLGNGTSGETPSLTPVDVTGLSSGIAAIAAGHYHTCALTTAGRVRCWGWNESGQLGDGTTQNRLIPVDVVGLSSGVTAIAAGLGHTCALTTAAGVQCWGANTWGELGDDSRQDRATPVNVVGLGSGVIAIAAGEAHSCALTTAGAVKCWGANSSGQLGDGAYQEQLRPVNAIGLSSGGAAISAGLRHTCALTTSGGVKCWGANWYGQLGHKQLWVLVDVVAGAEQTVFSVYGRVTDSAGQPLPDVEVEVIGRPSAVTDATGNYAIGGLARGRYTLRVHKTNYTFTPSWQTVDLQQDLADVNFAGAGLVVAPPLSGKPPLLIVHGIQTLDLTGYSCSQRAIMLQQQPPSTLGDMPAWFANSHEVWLAHLTSSALHTPSITDNARCLREQVNQVYTASGNRLVTVVAHSMGGLVTRACLSQSDCRDKVKAVYTLGTPHTGINWGLLSKLFIKLAEKSLAAHGIPIPLHDGICIWQAGYCQMSTEAMLHFNQNPGHYNQAEIKYTFIGGDATPAGFGTLLWALDGRNDGTVGRASAVGWNYAFGHTFATDHWTQPSHPTRYWTSEVHVSGLFHGNYAYSESRGGRESYAFDCIAYHAGIRETALPPWCRDAAMTISAADGATVPDLSQTTPSIADVLEEGQIVTHTLQIDTNGATSFALAWSDGIVDFSLIQPDGQRITPDYAAAHPSQILFTQTLVSAVLPAIATYHFTDTLPGEWQLIIHATDLGVPAMGYVAFAALDSPRTLSVSHSAASYTVAETATFTATLQGTSGSIIGATITATLDLPDGSHDLLTFTEIGNGLYRADYVVPHAGGRVAMSINVSGNDNGVVFYRQAEAIWTIIPEVARFTGVASDHGVDQNNDGAFDALQVDIDIEVMSPSIFSVSAALMQGDLLIDTTATDFAATTRGLHTVSLLFDGSDIAQRKLDGPYIVSQATLHDIDIGDVQIARVERLHTTQDYRASDFDVGQSEAVFLPVIFGD